MPGRASRASLQFVVGDVALFAVLLAIRCQSSFNTLPTIARAAHTLATIAAGLAFTLAAAAAARRSDSGSPIAVVLTFAAVAAEIPIAAYRIFSSTRLALAALSLFIVASALVLLLIAPRRD